MNEKITSFKIRLKEALEAKGLRPVDLCRKTHISQSTMSQYLSGYAEPKKNRLTLIADVLNVNPTWLMGLDVPMNIIADIDKNIFVTNLNLLLAIAKESYDPNKSKKLKITNNRLEDLQLGKAEPTIGELEIISNVFNIKKEILISIDLTQPKGKEVLDKALNPANSLFDLIEPMSIEEKCRKENLKNEKKEIIRKITTKLGLLDNEHLYVIYNFICDKIDESQDDHCPLFIKHIIYADERLVPVDEVEYDELLEKLNMQEETNENIKNTLFSLFDDKKNKLL